PVPSGAFGPVAVLLFMEPARWGPSRRDLAHAVRMGPFSATLHLAIEASGLTLEQEQPEPPLLQADSDQPREPELLLSEVPPTATTLGKVAGNRALEPDCVPLSPVVAAIITPG